MRTILLTVALAVAGLFGLSYTAPARADGVRVFVDLGDVYFTAGRPYYRHNHQPLYVARYAYGPRYYYSRPAYPVAESYGYGYAPRPVYYGYGMEYRGGHGYRDHDDYRDHDRHDRHDGYRGRGDYRDGHGDHDRDDRDDDRGEHGHGRGRH